MATNPFDRVSVRLCLMVALASGLITWIGVALVSAIAERGFGVAVSIGLDDPFAQVIWYTLVGVILAAVVRDFGVDAGRLVGPPLGARDALAALGPVVPLVGLSVAGVFLVYVPLSYPFPGFVHSFLLNDPEIFPTGRPTVAVANVLLLVVLAPIVEEFVFRGLVFTRWTHRYGLGAGIFGSAAAFATLHADMVGGFAFGLVQVALYAQTRSLRVPMLVHAGNNALGLVLIAVELYLPETGTIESFRAAWWLGLVGAIVGVPWFVRFLRSSRPTSSWLPPYLGDGASVG